MGEKSNKVKKSGKIQITFVGPMLGRHGGYVPSPAEEIAHHLAQCGYTCTLASSIVNRYLRFTDIIRVIVQERKRTDIICLQTFSGRSFVVEDIASWLGKQLRHCIVMVLHGGAMPEFMTRFPNWSRRVLSRAHVIVTPSTYLSGALEKFGFCAHIIPNTLDCHKYPYRHRTILTPHLIWMRAFHSAYNPEMAVRVLWRLSKSFPSATLTLAGPDKGSLTTTKRLAQKLGVAEATRFPGFLNMEAKIREGSVNDIYLNTNNIDNMPVSVLEMGAMGLPVVATAVGGIPHFLTNGQTGLLVPENDDEAMTEAIKRLLNDSALAGQLSASGRSLAEHCSWDHVGPQWEKLFSEVLACRKY
jgi:glycosyltransferase involved in cell wall biosynthesis